MERDRMREIGQAMERDMMRETGQARMAEQRGPARKEDRLGEGEE